MITPERFVLLRNQKAAQIALMECRVEELQKQAAACSLPADLRPAVASDIVLDAVIWYPTWADDPEDIQAWAIVEEVLRPSDSFKAYYYDGCRYGLNGAFVEVKS